MKGRNAISSDGIWVYYPRIIVLCSIAAHIDSVAAKRRVTLVQYDGNSPSIMEMRMCYHRSKLRWSDMVANWLYCSSNTARDEVQTQEHSPTVSRRLACVQNSSITAGIMHLGDWSSLKNTAKS